VHGRAPEPLIEPLNTAAGSNSTDSNSWERVLEALGTTSNDLKWINQRHRFNQWLADGFDLGLDILPKRDCGGAGRKALAADSYCSKERQWKKQLTRPHQ
jgi:hypothetical protein